MNGAFQIVTQWGNELAEATGSALDVTPNEVSLSKEGCVMRILRSQNGDLVWAIQSNSTSEGPLGGPLTYIRELPELWEMWEFLVSCPKE